jgi:hypothetical protein
MQVLRTQTQFWQTTRLMGNTPPYIWSFPEQCSSQENMAILFSRGRFFIFWLFYTYAEAQCYFPGGALASQQSPCDPYAYTTLCCPFGWTCFSNNLCIVTDLGAVNGDFPIGTAIRGTCTNPLWNNSECGDFCLSMYLKCDCPSYNFADYGFR